MLNKNIKKAYYMQISDTLESMIRSGYFCYGQKLPTLTNMKEIFNVSLKVAAQAYDNLNKMGLIHSKRGKGYFVSFFEHIHFDLEAIHQMEAKLVYDFKMKKEVVLFEIIEMNSFIAGHLQLQEGQLCYHIKQFIGKNHQHILLQELFLPVDDYPGLEEKYDLYMTTPSLVMNGYRYNIDEFSNQFYAGQASIEHELFLRLNQGDPIWRIESSFLSDEGRPIVFMNQYLSGEHIQMAVMIHVD